MKQSWSWEEAAEKRGPLLHPLAGARFRVFLRYALLTSGFDPRSRLQRLVAWGAQLLRLLPTAVEGARWNGAIRKSQLRKPPVFIVGHWRSGTTHLHNLMSRDPQFGFLTFAETAMPLNMLGPEVHIARGAIQSVLPETRGYDNVKLSLDEPQEEEMALGNLGSIGFYNTYYFPGNIRRHTEQSLFFEGAKEKEIASFRRNYEYLIRKLNLVKGGRQLLFKNPPSTGRIPMILEMFPDAKFIHIVRNPWPVFSSNCRKFSRLYNAFAWQSFQDVDIHEYTFATYERLMRQYLRDRDRLHLPSSQLCETSYEKLTENPVSEIARIYEQLGLEGEERGLGAIQEYQEEIRGYEGNQHSISAGHAAALKERWAFAFREWGYASEPPPEISVGE
ncbi:MAG: sulfotransferase [Verrucomicrobiales bacterium]|nr:sulfotransferase [Verrucomicrobiales bacterium]